jgi:photosystem II stability/assembly factor-like uncharacterized protein
VRVIFGLLTILSAASIASGQEWQRMGPQGGMVISLGGGTGNTAYLGTADGHIFARENESEPWQLRGRVGIRTDTVVSRLLADRDHAKIVYAAVWYQQPGAGGGVFRSGDGGRNWTLLGLEHEEVRALEMPAGQRELLVAGTRNGVFRSSNSGQTWERISPEGDPELRNVDSLAIDPLDAGVIYAGTYHLPWKTIDGGKSWKAVSAGLIDDSDIMSLRLDSRNPNRVFLSACSGIYRSENQGGSWIKLQGVPYASRRTQQIVQDPEQPQTWYAATTQGLWITRDAGDSWERTTQSDLVITSVVVLAGGENGKERLLIGTETRGVLTSENGGQSLREYNDGFNHQVLQQLIGDPRNPARLLMIMERNVDGNMGWLWHSDDAGTTWGQLPAAPNGKDELLFEREAVDKVFASPWGWMVRSSPGRFWMLSDREGKWVEWKLRLPATNTQSRNKQAHGKSPAEWIPAPNGREMGFSGENAYVSTKVGLLRCDLAGVCARIKAFAGHSTFAGLYVSPDGSVVALAAGSKLGISRDGGQTASWNDLPVLPSAVLWIDGADIARQQSLFLGSMNGLFASADDGSSWKRCEQGLPAGQVERLFRGREFLAATLREGGFYVSQDNGGTWSRMDQDSERGRTTGLVETAPGTLVLGSQSEGLLRWKNTAAQ